MSHLPQKNRAKKTSRKTPQRIGCQERAVRLIRTINAKSDINAMTPNQRAISLVLVAACAVMVGLAGVQLLIAPPIGGVKSTTSAVACDHPLSGAGSPNRATVYRITSSNAVLCLKYAYGSQAMASFRFNLQSWVQNGREVGALTFPCSIVHGEYRCPGFTVVPTRVSAVFVNEAESIELAYTIAASPGADGLYIFFLTPSNPIYLSFGPAPQSVYFTCWTSGPRLPTGVLPPSYNIIGGTNVDAMVVPWA